MTDRNYVKFFTPENVARFMAMLLDPEPDLVYLEPHAGDGNLIIAIDKYSEHRSRTFAVEINPIHEESLRRLADDYVINDFLLQMFDDDFDGCVANPPFGNGIDLQAHVDKICSLVKNGGNIVMLVPKDFDPVVVHVEYEIGNWSKNSDGTTTPIKIIKFINSK